MPQSRPGLAQPPSKPTMSRTGSTQAHGWSVVAAALAQLRSRRFVILCRIRDSIVQDGSSAESAMSKVSQCLRRFAHRIPDGCRAYAEPLGQPEKSLTVGAGIGGHRSQFALLKESVVIVQDWDVGQPDAGHGKRPAAIERT